MATLTMNNAHVSRALLVDPKSDHQFVAGFRCHLCGVDLPLEPLVIHESPEAWLAVLFHVGTEHSAMLPDVFLSGHYVDEKRIKEGV